jgi:XTP/dITP diphosphohydrolase
LSARFAGEPKSDERNNLLLLEKLSGQTDRAAHFVSLLVLVRHADDPQPIIAEGNWHGEILEAPCGEQGFGYDPLFWVPTAGVSAAEMAPETKNQCSHRAIAMQQLLARLATF